MGLPLHLKSDAETRIEDIASRTEQILPNLIVTVSDIGFPFSMLFLLGHMLDTACVRDMVVNLSSAR